MGEHCRKRRKIDPTIDPTRSGSPLKRPYGKRCPMRAPRRKRIPPVQNAAKAGPSPRASCPHSSTATVPESRVRQSGRPAWPHHCPTHPCVSQGLASIESWVSRSSTMDIVAPLHKSEKETLNIAFRYITTTYESSYEISSLKPSPNELPSMGHRPEKILQLIEEQAMRLDLARRGRQRMHLGAIVAQHDDLSADLLCRRSIEQ